MKAAVLGKPIAHSLSPALHRAAYRELGFDDWTYDLVECDESGLPEYVDGRGPEWAGLSLTMPLKRTVLPLLDHVDPMAAATGGANTVVFRPDGRYGYNTDVQGIVDALTEAGAPSPGTVTIIGAGATACSALAAVGELGAPGADVILRDPARGGAVLATAQKLGLKVRLRPLDDQKQGDAVVPDLLISTVPAGAADPFTERSLFSRTPPMAVMDVVYHPWPTPLAEAAAAAGAIVASGFAMLLHQAAAQVELMTGKPAPLEAMRAAGEAELAARASGSLVNRAPRANPLAVRPLHRVGRVLVAPLAQPLDHALDVLGRPVLAELGLRLDPADDQLHPDDRPQLPLDERPGRVVSRPRVLPGGLVLAGQPPDQVLDPHRVVVQHQLPVHVRGDVVPGRHHPAVLQLRGVEPGRDVRVPRPPHDGEGLAQRVQLPLVVVPGHVPVQRPVLAGRRHPHERQHRRHQPLGRHRDQISRPVIAEQFVNKRLIRQKMGRYVHAALRSRPA
jgi:shikimate dehydrogenase